MGKRDHSVTTFVEASATVFLEDIQMATGDRHGCSRPLLVPYYRFHDAERVAGHEFDVLFHCFFCSRRGRSWKGKLNIDIGLLLLVYGFEIDDYKYSGCYTEAPQGCHGTTATFNYSVSFQSTVILRPHL